MRKKILIGSIFVLTLLLLMPSIHAIQHKTVEDSIYNDLIEQFDLKNVKEIKRLERIKHPILFDLVMFLISFREKRTGILWDISIKITHWHGGPIIEIKHPILFLRCLWLILTIEYWYSFWNKISDRLGWDWELPY